MTPRRLLPVAAYLGLLWLARGPRFVAIALVGGIAMALGFTLWHRVAPASLQRSTDSLNRVLGGAPGEVRPWRDRTRGTILVAIGLLGVPAGLHVTRDPEKFVGGSAGGAVLTALALGALVVGARLISSSRA